MKKKYIIFNKENSTFLNVQMRKTKRKLNMFNTLSI